MTAPDAEVVVVGSGPAGLAAAIELGRRGIRRILIVERDEVPGGLPRFCQHLGFGWEYSRRIERGPRFVARLLNQIDEAVARILTRTTALRIAPGPRVDLVGPEVGCVTLQPKAILVATGIRERPRGARLVPGSRPERGVLTTGLLQQMVARHLALPGPRMVIVGTEHVAFSAILTGRHAGLRTLAMVEPSDRVTSWPAAAWAARRFLGARILLQSTIAEIIGGDSVEAVLIRGSDRRTHEIACDCVVFSAGWRPDAVLLAESGAAMDAAAGPIIDQMMRTTLPGVFAAGNVLRAIESSGIAALEGRAAGRRIAAYLQGRLAAGIGGVRIEKSDVFAYVVPQCWALDAESGADADAARLSLRAAADCVGRVVLTQSDRVIWLGTPLKLRAGRQLRLSLPDLSQLSVEPGELRIALLCP